MAIKPSTVLASLVASLLLTSTSGPATGAVARDTVTRADAAMVLLLSRMSEVPDMYNGGEFPDIPAGSWYERYMIAAARYGIITPRVGGFLDPLRPVTRAEFLKMLTYTFNLAWNLPYHYQDVPQTAWYAPYAGEAEKYKLFDDDAPLRLFPDVTMSHTEAAHAMRQLLSIQSDVTSYVTPPATKTPTYVISTQGLSVVVLNTAKTKIVPASRASGASNDAMKNRALASIRATIVAKTNALRSQAKVSPVIINPGLQASAQRYAETMAKQGFFGHRSPLGETLQERIATSGYYDAFFAKPCNCVRRYILGENLAQGQRNAEEVISSWMRSAAHRKAMLHKSFTDIGIGVAVDGSNKVFWVEEFGGIE